MKDDGMGWFDVEGSSSECVGGNSVRMVMLA